MNSANRSCSRHARSATGQGRRPNLPACVLLAVLAGLLSLVPTATRAADPDPPPDEVQRRLDQQLLELQRLGRTSRDEIADVEAAKPTTRPATPPALLDQIPTLFGQLDSADYATREKAFTAMMGLGRDSLPRLAALVKERAPVSPAQLIALREIVAHVFLTGESYLALDHSGFLGVTLGSVRLTLRPTDDQDANHDSPIDTPFGESMTDCGVLIAERMPGFCGARWLRDGDIVIALRRKDDKSMEIVQTIQRMRDLVKDVPAGQEVTFRLLRQGRLTDVKIALDPRPEAAEAFNAGLNTMTIMLNQRQTAAEEYWQQVFAPLVGEEVG